MLKADDPIRCPDGTWFILGESVPLYWGSSEAAILSAVSERVGSIDVARDLLKGGDARWQQLGERDAVLHRLLARKLKPGWQDRAPAQIVEPPADEDEDDRDDAPMSAREETMRETMEVQEVAAEAPAPAPEVSALEAATPVTVPPTPAATPTEEAAHPAYQWMTAREMGKVFGVEKSTLRLWAQAGKLETRPCDPGRALGPRALEYRIPPGKPVPTPGPQSNAARLSPTPKPPPQKWAEDGTHMAYQWTQGSRAIARLLDIEANTVSYWVSVGKLEQRPCESDARACEYRIPPGKPVPVPAQTGGRSQRAMREAAHAPAPAPQTSPAPAQTSPSRIDEETRLHAQLTAARSRCAELDAQIEVLTAQLAAQTQRERGELLDAGERELQLATHVEALEGQIEELTAQLAKRDGMIARIEKDKADALASLTEAVTRLRAQVAEEAGRARVAEEALASGAAQAPVTLRSVIDLVERWMGASLSGLDLRLETGARLTVTP